MLGASLRLLFLAVAMLADASDGKRCCPEGTYLLESVSLCWTPKTNLSNATPISMSCSQSYPYKSDPRNMHSFIVDDKNVLNVSTSEYYFEVAESSWCVANTTTLEDIVSLNNVNLTYMLCFDEPADVFNDINGYCTIVSVVFLALTAIVYAILPEVRDLQGKSVLSFCIVFSVGLLILAIMKLNQAPDMNHCSIRGFLTYFLLISAFFWMNSIAIQILRSIRRPTIIDYGYGEYVWYALYAFGVPLLLTVCMSIVNFMPGDHDKPGLGVYVCWFMDMKQKWIYMYSVMSLIIVANTAIFAYVSVVLWRQRFTSNHIKALKYKFIMSTRLFILMGLPWIFEFISSFLEDHIIWKIMDIVNLLQGLLIFIMLVVLRKRVLKALQKRNLLPCMASFLENYLAANDDLENIAEHVDVTMVSSKN